MYIVKKIADLKINVVEFQNFQKSNFDGGKFLKIRSSINLSWGHMGLQKKLGPDRFSRLLDTNKQTDKQTDRQTDRQTSQIYI